MFDTHLVCVGLVVVALVKPEVFVAVKGFVVRKVKGLLGKF